MRWLPSVVWLTLGACGYRAGSLHPADPGSGRVTVVDCLDVMVEPIADAEATGAAVAISFGNRCDHAVRVDLAAVRAVGRFADGSRRSLVAYDPDGAIHAGRLDPRRAGREAIEYQDPGDAAARPVEVCLTLGGITGGGERPPIECVVPAPPAEPPPAGAAEPTVTAEAAP